MSFSKIWSPMYCVKSIYEHGNATCNAERTHFRLRERRTLENVRYPCPCIWTLLKLRQDSLGHLLLHAPHMRLAISLLPAIDLSTYFLSYTRVECDDHIVHDRDIELPREVQDALHDREYHATLGKERAYLHGGEAIGERVRPSSLWWSMAKQTWLT